ncbi:uncharacterized protein [Argopecten irradians]|uniref:uncharacterized protein isoform X2 n=1 Tax=Argopecten irradians TaxID=31199 RepID=UPI003715B5E2
MQCVHEQIRIIIHKFVDIANPLLCWELPGCEILLESRHTDRSTFPSTCEMELGPSAMSNTINGSGGSGGSDGSNGSGPYELPPSPTTDHDSAGYAHFDGQTLGEREETTRQRQYACGCKRRIVISIVVGFLLVLAIAAGVIYHVTSSTEEVVCPYTEEYSRVHIWSPRKKIRKR